MKKKLIGETRNSDTKVWDFDKSIGCVFSASLSDNPLGLIRVTLRNLLKRVEYQNIKRINIFLTGHIHEAAFWRTLEYNDANR